MIGAVALAGCATTNPASSGPDKTSSSSGGAIVVGSANFPEDEILAQIYTQALQQNGVKASIKPNIGARPVYIKALQDGSIDLVPEYTGNLLQYFDSKATAAAPADVYAELSDNLPKGFEVLPYSSAQDKDSYNVTKTFSQKWGVTSLSDLKKVTTPLTVAANPEFQTRPYGIPGLQSDYGVKATLLPINDSGGPNTVKALQDGTVQLADIYSTTPAIKQDGFVTLSDPKNLILAQNVVPLINSNKASDKVKSVLNTISKALTTDDLIAMNTKSSGSAKESAQQIAQEWLAQENLFK